MTKLSDFEQKLKTALPQLHIRQNEPLAAHTSFGIGGPAALFAEPAGTEELAGLYRLCLENGIEPVILGSGTNVLAPDEGLDALVVRTRNVSALERTGEAGLTAECGVTLARLAQLAAKAGLTGLEFAHGIPGSVGGGVLMNAGAYGGEIKDVCCYVNWLSPDGERKTLTGAEAGFAYRHSTFMHLGGLILSACFALTAGDPEAIAEKMSELARKRRASQPLELPSAGSTFKRPEGGFAAALIDRAGLKGFRIGGAAVSEKHAGFVVNLGGATCADVQGLIAHIRKAVFDESGIMLEPEVRILHR